MRYALSDYEWTGIKPVLRTSRAAFSGGNAWPSRPPPRMYVSAIVSSALPLWHWSGDGAATPVTLGSCLMARRSHGYPDFLPRLTHRRDVCVAWIRLPSVVAT